MQSVITEAINHNVAVDPMDVERDKYYLLSFAWNQTMNFVEKASKWVGFDQSSSGVNAPLKFSTTYSPNFLQLL